MTNTGSGFEFDIPRTQAENDAEWSSHYRSLLDTKLEEAMKSPSFATSSGNSSGKTIRKHQARTKVDKLPRHEPTFMVSAIAQSKKEVRNVKDQLAKMEKRAQIAEDRAKEATVMERKARAALDARDKQVASMRLRLDKLSGNLIASEAQRKELQAYVGKLERKVTAGNVKKGSFAVLSATPIKRVEKESLLDALAELQDENTRLHGALREVEEAVDVEAKSLGLADGGALLESLRTRRLLESAELALKREVTARKQVEENFRKAETRARVAEDERGDRVKAEEALLARCEIAERDNQTLLEYIEELTTKRRSPSPSKRMSVFSHSQIKDMRENSGDVPVNSDDAARVMRLTWEPLSVSVPLSDAKAEKPLEASIDTMRTMRAEFKKGVGQDHANHSDSSEEDSPGADTHQPRRAFPVSPPSKPKGGNSAVFANRLDRITNLKKRLGLKAIASSRSSKGSRREFIDESDDD